MSMAVLRLVTGPGAPTTEVLRLWCGCRRRIRGDASRARESAGKMGEIRVFLVDDHRVVRIAPARTFMVTSCRV